MKRPVRLLRVRLLSMIAAALVAAPAAMAGNDIVKCVDGSGHVTLTDQPCDSGSATVRLEQDIPAPQRHVLPAVELRHEAWKRTVVERPAPLSRDVATLKAAYRNMVMQDAKPRLVAGLD